MTKWTDDENARLTAIAKRGPLHKSDAKYFPGRTIYAMRAQWTRIKDNPNIPAQLELPLSPPKNLYTPTIVDYLRGHGLRGMVIIDLGV